MLDVLLRISQVREKKWWKTFFSFCNYFTANRRGIDFKKVNFQKVLVRLTKQTDIDALHIFQRCPCLWWWWISSATFVPSVGFWRKAWNISEIIAGFIDSFWKMAATCFIFLIFDLYRFFPGGNIVLRFSFEGPTMKCLYRMRERPTSKSINRRLGQVGY